MNILEKFSNLLSSNNSVKTEIINNICNKYSIEFPFSMDDFIKIDRSDISNILKEYDQDNYNELLDAFNMNMTVIKMYNSNPSSMFFKEKYEQAILYINNLVININAYFSKINSDISNEIKDKYNKIITKDGINDTIANLDELDSLLDSLNITLYEKGKIKQEVGKSNVRLAITNKKISEEDKKLFEKIEKIIKDESNLLRVVSKDMIEDYINGNLEEDNPDLRMVTLITGMYSEMNKAKNNLGNSSLYNYSIKLINEYINAYEKLKEE